MSNTGFTGTGEHWVIMNYERTLFAIYISSWCIKLKICGFKKFVLLDLLSYQLQEGFQKTSSESFILWSLYKFSNKYSDVCRTKYNSFLYFKTVYAARRRISSPGIIFTWLPNLSLSFLSILLNFKTPIVKLQ